MPETLLSPSNILLYGREMEDITLRPDVLKPIVEPEVTPDGRIKDAHGAEPEECHTLPPPPPPPRLNDNNFLLRALVAPGARLARIYGFSYDGHYYDLAKPAIFLVHGPGSDPEAWRPDTALPNARVDRAPSDADRSGIARTATSFAEDVRVWSYDKGDFSLRLDPESGPFEQILLQAELRPDKQQTYYSGQSAFASGQSVFMSGQSVFLRGRGRNMGD
jgi:hypothetical protein